MPWTGLPFKLRTVLGFGKKGRRVPIKIKISDHFELSRNFSLDSLLSQLLDIGKLIANACVFGQLQAVIYVGKGIKYKPKCLCIYLYNSACKRIKKEFCFISLLEYPKHKIVISFLFFKSPQMAPSIGSNNQKLFADFKNI